MSDLTDFLLSRIAEDEAVVKALNDERLYGPTVPVDTGDDPWPTERAFAERWPPERVLAECEAKRRIVEEWSYAVRERRQAGRPGVFDVVEVRHALDDADRVLPYLALPYADHPDYDESWRP